ncbi:MAG: hypothetical protein HYV65_03290 [Candidatus Spechtbacteria bacterium]|nr:hypothetical protein [Candidatus Spechtbacteria bacterium]
MIPSVAASEQGKAQTRPSLFAPQGATEQHARNLYSGLPFRSSLRSKERRMGVVRWQHWSNPKESQNVQFSRMSLERATKEGNGPVDEKFTSPVAILE